MRWQLWVALLMMSFCMFDVEMALANYKDWCTTHQQSSWRFFICDIVLAVISLILMCVWILK